MNRIILSLAILALSANTIVFGDVSEQVFTLKDGSQIKGVLSGIDKGVYTVKTPIIGDVHVAVGDVASITNPNAALAGLPTNNTNAPAFSNSSSTAIPNLDQQVAAGQQQLLSNPQSMALLQQMMQNPEIMQALQDPALVQAVTNHDYQAVASNPAVQKLMGNPQMQEILQKLAAQQQKQ